MQSCLPQRVSFNHVFHVSTRFVTNLSWLFLDPQLSLYTKGKTIESHFWALVTFFEMLLPIRSVYVVQQDYINSHSLVRHASNTVALYC